MKSEKKLIAKIHHRQGVRHVVANKVQLALTILKELESERAVEPRLIKRAILDLRVILRFLDKQALSEKNSKRG